MKILWSFAAWSDVDRVHSFMARYELEEANAILDRLASAPSSLLEFPRRGLRLSEFDPREVRELRTGRYVMRYELTNDEVRVLRVFHAKQTRA